MINNKSILELSDSTLNVLDYIKIQRGGEFFKLNLQAAITAGMDGNFASPPTLGYGSTTPRPVAATTLNTSGATSFSVAGAASTPAVLLNGAIYAAGTGTTTFPHLFVQPSGATAATTWSTAGTLIGGNAASGFIGNMLDLKLAGAASSAIKVTSAGNLTVAGTITTSTNQTITSGANVNIASGFGVFVGGQVYLYNAGLGHAVMSDGAGGEAFKLSFAGVTSSYPTIKRNGAEFQVALANSTTIPAPDAELSFVEDRYRRKGAGDPNSVVTAPIGAIYHRTDGGAGTSVYFKESGAGDTGWVAK